MTPYLDGHDDLSAAVFISLVGFWELDKDEVPPEYFEVFAPQNPTAHPSWPTLTDAYMTMQQHQGPRQERFMAPCRDSDALVVLAQTPQTLSEML